MHINIYQDNLSKIKFNLKLNKLNLAYLTLELPSAADSSVFKIMLLDPMNPIQILPTLRISGIFIIFSKN